MRTLLAVAIAATLLSPVISIVGDNSGNVEVTNESLSTTFDEYQEVRGYDLDDGETVYYDSGTGYTEATAGTDYEVNQSAGTIELLSGGAISEGDDVQVSYNYQATDGATTSIIVLVPLLFALLIVATMAAKVQGMM